MPIIALLTVLGLTTGAPGGDHAHTHARDWRAQADHLLNLPEGSVSLGHTSGGHLVGARRMPRRGKGFALLPHIPSRKTNFGTDEIVGLLTRTAERLNAKKHYGTMRIGNIGFRRGGRIPWSVSHRAGRDADIAFFVTDTKGRPVRPDDFVKMDTQGRSEDGRYRFDTHRNVQVVRALLEDDTVDVQWIFVQRNLRRKLLRMAARKNFPAALVTRMETVMRQPSDSAPHNDHFHVRIYCSAQDTLHGCHNRGPFHPWVKPATAAYRERVTELEAITRDAPDARYRKRAIDKLVTLDARSSVDTLIARLDDPDDRVFDATVDALGRLMRSSKVAALAAPLARQDKPARAAALMRLIARRGTEHAAAVALKVLTAPARALSQKLQSVAERAPTWLAALPLLGRYGRKAEATALVRKLLPDLSRKDLLNAAHDALRLMTNVDPITLRLPRTKTRSARRPGLVDRWTAFLDQYGHDSWIQWVRLGFEARGFKFKRRMWSTDSVPVLIRAAAHRDPWVNTNAVRVLNGLTGQSVDPHKHDRRWRARWFRDYWKRHRRTIRSAKR